MGAGSCASTSVTSSSGSYQLTIPLDGCGTSVSQSNHEITFSNSIVGNSDAVTVDGIVLTDTLGFDFSCTYSDHFDLDQTAHVTSSEHVLAGEEESGSFSAQFQLQSFTDSAFTVLSSAANPVVVGESVFNRVSISGSMPSNINFVVTDCVAQDDDTAPTVSYNIILDGCLAQLVKTTELSSDLVGNSANTVDFKFNGFTFAAGSDSIYLKCSISLCAIVEGELVESGCGFNHGGDSCAALSASSSMGYSMGTGISED